MTVYPFSVTVTPPLFEMFTPLSAAWVSRRVKTSFEEAPSEKPTPLPRLPALSGVTVGAYFYFLDDTRGRSWI